MSSIELRPAASTDQPFFAALYRSTRDDLLGMIADPRYVDALVAMQQQMQVAGYRASYPDALYEVVELDGAAAGRLVTAEVGDTLRVVDIAVMPWARGRGVAGTTLRRVRARAAREGRDVALAVRKDNAGARRLYAALGFTQEGEDAFSLQLRWRVRAGAMPGSDA